MPFPDGSAYQAGVYRTGRTRFLYQRQGQLDGQVLSEDFRYTREGINAKIEALGAHAGSSVSSKTNYLICGENAGSKLEKAKALGVTVLTPAKFFRMAGE